MTAKVEAWPREHRRRMVSTPWSAQLRGRRVRDTEPEKTLRSAVHGLGLRFRLHRKVAPRCTADFVLPRYSVAAFVDGCFWHGCPSTRRGVSEGRTPRAGKPRSRPTWKGTPVTPKRRETPDGPWCASGSVRSGRTPGGPPSASPTPYTAASRFSREGLVSLRLPQHPRWLRFPRPPADGSGSSRSAGSFHRRAACHDIGSRR